MVMKSLRVALTLVALGAMLGVATAASESPRAFRASEWRPYARRADPFGALPDDRVEERDLRPFGAWSPASSWVLLTLHLVVTLGLASRAGLSLYRLSSSRRRSSDRAASPYRRGPEGATEDAAHAAARRMARVEVLVFTLAAVAPCATTMREVIVLRAAGETVRATPVAIGWFDEIVRRPHGEGREVEAHGVRARATVAGRAVTLEASCGFGLAQRLDGGRVGDGAVPFVVWPRVPSVHQIGEAPVVGHVAGWVHVALLALAAAWASAARPITTDGARDADPPPPRA